MSHSLARPIRPIRRVAAHLSAQGPAQASAFVESTWQPQVKTATARGRYPICESDTCVNVSVREKEECDCIEVRLPSPPQPSLFVRRRVWDSLLIPIGSEFGVLTSSWVFHPLNVCSVTCFYDSVPTNVK